ncbi:MAG: hypothetical protein K2X54_14170 [Methylobacterium organophilum]|jgi:hypothetical protein|nr:hypothetical protein [Methylobacterium organophilum]
MTAYLLTYDLEETSPDPRSIVKSELRKAGWYSRVKKGDQSWAYPNTTMGGPFDSDADAVEAYRSAIRNAKAEARRQGKGAVVIEKVYITQRTEVLFETDDKRPADD